jgi:hypothetical protein
MESLKNAKNYKIENVAGSVWLSLSMDGNEKCALPSTQCPLAQAWAEFKI